MQEAIDRYRQHTRSSKTPKDQRFFGDWWGKQFAAQRLNAITVERLETIRDELLAGERTPQRVNRYLSWLRACLNLAIKKKKLTSNPVCQLTMFPETEGKLRALDVKEEATLLEAISPIYGPWVRFAILTGLRQKEQFTLQWSD